MNPRQLLSVTLSFLYVISNAFSFTVLSLSKDPTRRTSCSCSFGPRHHTLPIVLPVPLLRPQRPHSPFSTTRISAKEQDTDEEGEALAKEFFRQARNNENETAGRQQQPDIQENAKKFTGKSTEAGTGINRRRPMENSLFEPSRRSDTTGESNSVSNLQREREREFNLSSIFQRTLPIQAAFLFLSLAFVLYVGFSGGITDGSDRSYDDEMDVDIEYLNSIRTDDSSFAPTPETNAAKSSVWL